MWGDTKARVLVQLKPQYGWSGSEICEISTQKKIIWFQSFWDLLFFTSRHKNHKRCHLMNKVSVLVYFTVVNNHLESKFHVACVDKLLSTVNSVLIDSANDIISKKSIKWPNLNTVVCPFYLGIILILFVKFIRPWLISITLTNLILI